MIRVNLHHLLAIFFSKVNSHLHYYLPLQHHLTNEKSRVKHFEDTVSDIIIRGFVKDFDSVTVELDESSGMV